MADKKERDPERLQVLLKPYELDRADDSQALSAMYTLLAVTVGLMSLIGFALINAKDDNLPGWVIALSPLAPLPFIAFGAIHSYAATMRGTLIALHEKELRTHYGKTLRGRDLPKGIRVPVEH